MPPCLNLRRNILMRPVCIAAYEIDGPRAVRMWGIAMAYSIAAVLGPILAGILIYYCVFKPIRRQRRQKTFKQKWPNSPPMPSYWGGGRFVFVQHQNGTRSWVISPCNCDIVRRHQDGTRTLVIDPFNYERRRIMTENLPAGIPPCGRCDVQRVRPASILMVA